MCMHVCIYIDTIAPESSVVYTPLSGAILQPPYNITFQTFEIVSARNEPTNQRFDSKNR
jgi:hypothetical protein